MHGRVKVRTTEEEKAKKEKEKQVKLIFFKKVMTKIQAMRQDGLLNKDLLECIGQLLTSNPDIYTLWNIRREVLTVMKKEQNEDEMAKLHDSELNLTEHCLKVNPKSYCAWHQREWVLTTRPDPDWKKELELCNTYLKLDERNFHTWDYRRFVVTKYKSSFKDEFDFTTEKLLNNFSNYSAWHYRSKMLIELYPDLKGGRPIEDSHHKHELEMVQSAAFTDPDDTSAWFYQRWLLGAVKKSVQVIVCTVSDVKTSVAFNDIVSESHVADTVKIFFNDTKVIGKWESCTGNDFDTLWLYKHSEDVTQNLKIKVLYKASDLKQQVIECDKQQGHLIYVGKSEINFQNQYAEPVLDELKRQLDSCRQLLDLEPDSKWTLLATTVFLHCINPKLYHEESIYNLRKLIQIDNMRSGYYDYLISKWSIEYQLVNTNESAISYKPSCDRQISSLCHLQYFSYFVIINLSNQNLSSRILPSLVMLQHCKELSLENNGITTLRTFPKLELNLLNLKGNKNIDENDLQLLRENVTFTILY